MKVKEAMMLAKRLYERRCLLGLSQKELALKANISPPYYNNIEKGKRDPSLFVICKLSRALKVPVSSLLSLDSTHEVSLETGNLKEIQSSLCVLIRTIGELYERCDSPEEVMNLLLDIGDDGRINHPKNEAFMDLLEAMVPLAGEVLKAVKHGKEDL